MPRKQKSPKSSKKATCFICGARVRRRDLIPTTYKNDRGQLFTIRSCSKCNEPPYPVGMSAAEIMVDIRRKDGEIMTPQEANKYYKGRKCIVHNVTFGGKKITEGDAIIKRVNIAREQDDKIYATIVFVGKEDEGFFDRWIKLDEIETDKDQAIAKLQEAPQEVKDELDGLLDNAGL